MKPPEDRVARSHRLALEMVRVAERAKADFAAAVEPFGLPVPLARALLLLETPTPMHLLAEQLACDRSWVTGLADGLEERGLVKRAPGADRRVKLLELTPAGESLRSEVARAAGEGSVVMRRLSDDERSTLDRLLARLVEEPASGD